MHCAVDPERLAIKPVISDAKRIHQLLLAKTILLTVAQVEPLGEVTTQGYSARVGVVKLSSSGRDTLPDGRSG